MGAEYNHWASFSFKKIKNMIKIEDEMKLGSEYLLNSFMGHMLTAVSLLKAQILVKWASAQTLIKLREMDVIFFYFDELITYILDFLWHVPCTAGNLNFE